MRKFTSLNAYIRKEEKYKISHLSFHLRKLEREEKENTQARRRKEIKIRAEISEIENRKSIETTNKTKSWFIEKINKIYKPLSRLTTMRKREKTDD